MLAQIATLDEIETRWSIVDLFDAHEALDVKEEYEEHARRKTERKIKGGRSR